jgi:alanyl-tRNA synthetase
MLMKQVRQKRAKYTPEQLESVAEKLRSMPPVEEKKKSAELSKQEAIKALSKDIRAMQKRGYTLEMIANILKAENISVSVPTLRNYLQAQRGRPAASTRRTRRGASTPEETQAE